MARVKERPIAVGLAFIVVLSCFGTALQQPKDQITKQSLINALRYGKTHKTKRHPTGWWIDRLKRNKVPFDINADDEHEIRGSGDYLGNDGLDKIIATIRTAYKGRVAFETFAASLARSPAPTPKPRIRKDLPRVGKDGEPLTLITGIEITGSFLELTYLGELMRGAGYKGQSAVMSYLIVKNNDESGYSLSIGARPEAAGATGKEISKTLEPGDQFEFPAGVNAAKVYVSTMSTAKIDIAFRPMPIESLSVRDWLETDDGKRFANQMLADIDKLIDEARAIDLRVYKSAIRTYNEWVDKVSLGLAQVDIQMRRLDKRTSYKFDWDTRNHSFVEMLSDEQRNKRSLSLDINEAILALEIARSQIKMDTSSYSLK